MTSAGTPPMLEETYTVRTHHLDRHGRFTMLAFCTMLLDAAGTHAHDLHLSVPDLMADGKTWMLGRFGVSLLHQPHWREKLRIATWPSGIERLAAMRDFEVRGEDDTLIGTGVSSWLVIDLATRRPVRVEPFLAPHIPETGLRPSRGHGPRLGELTDPTGSHSFKVRGSDIDFNGHVTSTSYIAWALECVPAGITGTHEAAAFDIAFRAETFPGETVLSQSRIADPGSGGAAFMHRIASDHDGRELARARSIWRPATRR